MLQTLKAHCGHNDCAYHVVPNPHLEFAKAAAKIKVISSYFKKTNPELNVILTLLVSACYEWKS